MADGGGPRARTWIERSFRGVCRVLPVGAGGEFVEECCAEISVIRRDPTVRFEWIRAWHAFAYASGAVWAARAVRTRSLARTLRADFHLATAAAGVSLVVVRSNGMMPTGRSGPGSWIPSRLEFCARVACWFLALRTRPVESVSYMEIIGDLAARLSAFGPEGEPR